MTPKQKLRWAILAQAAEWEKRQAPAYPCQDVDKLYDDLVEGDRHWDAESEIRCGGTDTGLKCGLSKHSRHYESKAVAMKMPDGSWVGWTYWYGGGKHGEPGAVEWMDDAYDVDCQEEEKLVVVQTFKVRGEA